MTDRTDVELFTNAVALSILQSGRRMWLSTTYTEPDDLYGPAAAARFSGPNRQQRRAAQRSKKKGR